MNTRSRLACTLAAFLAVHLSSHAAVTVFHNNLPGFTATAGILPVVNFDQVLEGTDLAGTSILGMTLTSPAGNTLQVVTASSTVTPGGFVPVIGDSDQRLVATSGSLVLSPGGSVLVPGPNLAEQDGLRLVFDVPVRSFGVDLLFQSLDGNAFTTYEVRNAAGTVIASGVVTIPTNGPGADGTSISPEGGTYFIGFHSDQTDISRIDFIEGDGDADNPDSNIGYDTIRVVAACDRSTLYEFTQIADSTNFFSAQTFATLDDNGRAAFAATASRTASPTNSNAGIFSSGLSGAATIADDTIGHSLDFGLLGYAMNPAGRVVFGSATGFVYGIRTRLPDGSPIATVADETGGFTGLILPEINAANQVVFLAGSASLPPSGRGIFAGSATGGPTSLIVDDSGIFEFEFGVPIQRGPAISDAGVVAFYATLDAGGAGIFARPAAGGPVSTIADASGNPVNVITAFDLSGTGTVAFSAGSNGAGGPGVFTRRLSGGPTTTVADFSNGYDFPDGVAINDAGAVAFFAFHSSAFGIYTGPNPSRDGVIAVGDPLFCSTVTALSLSRGGLNNRGQIAFSYILADGRQGVAVATPRGNLRILSITRPLPGTIRLDVSGIPGLSHRILASPDLIQPFLDIGTRTAAPDGSFQYDDATALPMRFYKVSVP